MARCILRHTAFVITVIALFPAIVIANVIGNSGGAVKGELKVLIHNASVNTTMATSIMYEMIADIEDLKKDSQKSVSYYGEFILCHLRSSVKSLQQANQIPDSEFRMMNQWLRRIDKNIPGFHGYNPESSLWGEVLNKSRMGGKAWLNQNIKLNENLIQVTENFLRVYKDRPEPTFVWRLIRDWNTELYRSIYLSMIFTEFK